MVFFAWIAVTVFKDLDHGNEAQPLLPCRGSLEQFRAYPKP